MRRLGFSARLDERGLTLAEILVALAVLGLGLVGLAVVIPVSSYGVQEGNQLSTAAFLAEQMVERTRAVAWTAFLNAGQYITSSDRDGIHFEASEQQKLGKAVAEKVREILG